MGTSTSSAGPIGNVPFDPPWLDGEDVSEDTTPNPEEEQSQDGEDDNPSEEDGVVPIDLAPKGRFGYARKNLGQFLDDGSKQSLGKALGGYVGKGMGGATRLTKRMQNSARIGADIYSLFQSIRSGTSTDTQTRDLIRYLSSESSSSENFKNAIIKHVLPAGGSLDEEMHRNSLAQAMSDLLEKQPDIDLTKMKDVEILSLLENFIINVIVNRIIIDIGRAFENKKLSPQEIVARRNGLKEYVRSTVSEYFRRMKKQTANPTGSEIRGILISILKEIFKVFEGYL